MAVNKVVFGNTIVMDITDSTVTASKLKSGETAYAANGAKITGELIVPEVLDDLSDVIIVSPENAHEIYYDGSQWINYGAKILLTFDDAFQGQTITLVNGQTTITKTAPLTGNSMSLYINETGEWTISSTIDQKIYETVVTVTTFGLTFEAELNSTSTPEGATVLPTDDIQTWLACANITDKSYTTLEEVLADRATFETLIADSNACDYMARSTSWANDVADNADAMALIGKYDYCSNALLSNATWAEAIANSDYWNSVLQPLVPIMTSATTPNGEVICSSQNSSYPAWKAFDGIEGSSWESSTGGSNQYIGYIFPQNTKVFKIGILPYGLQYSPKDIKIQTKVNDSWIDNGSYTCLDSRTWHYFNTEAFILSDSWRLYCINNYGRGNIDVNELQFYGRSSNEVLVPLVPTMTSNTTPSGTCSASSQGDGQEAWRAFDRSSSDFWNSTQTSAPVWIQYDFAQNTKVDVAEVQFTSYSTSATVQIQKADGTPLSDSVTISGTTKTLIPVNSDGGFGAYRLYISAQTKTSTYAGVCQSVQFYQRTVQTNIVHSCANDTIYYMEDGSPVIVATTNSDGDGILDFSTLEDKEYTFYSSVAKDPSNLSNDYSKSIRITKSEFGGTTEMYLMPDNAGYWYGYIDNNLVEELSTTNGWSFYTIGFTAPIYNTNNLTLNNGHGQTSSGLAYKTKKNNITAKSIYQATTMSAGNGGSITLHSSKSMADEATLAVISAQNTNLQTLSLSITSEGYITADATYLREGTLYAFWYE